MTAVIIIYGCARLEEVDVSGKIGFWHKFETAVYLLRPEHMAVLSSWFWTLLQNQSTQ